jgi:protein-disulfide isomerase
MDSVRMIRGIVVSGLLLALAGCQDQGALDEIRNSQKEVLAKLASVEKTQKDILAKTGPGQIAAQRPNAPDPNQVYQIPVGTSPVKGKANAPVTLVEFSDFQCPFCAQASKMPEEVLQAYPDKVTFIYKHFPLEQIHPNAKGAAKAACAAQKQGKFWEMHDELFANSRALQAENLKNYAQKVGLDVQKFEADFNSPDCENAVAQDVATARQAQVSGTPTFFLNGKRVQNRSTDAVKAMVEEALKGGAPNKAS